MKHQINIHEAIKRFRELNLAVLPVPGTSKYCVSFPEGQCTLLKEKMLLEMACSLKEKQASEVYKHLQASAR
ncbi:NEDD8-activating enzyme E1 regulatory subunit [Desulforamulus aquiferis]|uniref:NEDD8-activating enzyme E1 regulatory subunit n=1 Tax=Desulforamulus aquiferis TaxID=1397668 RepID=A0AAW7ZA53_9FIRM|nr:NEDD8-activating enzyme E1 regulatory subunit [Desulforamulus aquiferis]MDO7786514.1 NEDD8-activating enzyme E1 regulatory subunit [Desulforamulus aquiferis]